MIQPNRNLENTLVANLTSSSDDRTPLAPGKRCVRALLVRRVEALPEGELTSKSGRTTGRVIRTLGGSTLELQVAEPTRETITTVRTVADSQHAGRTPWMEIVASQRSVDVTTGEITEAAYPMPEEGSGVEALSPMAIFGAVSKAMTMHQVPTVE